MSRKMIRAMEKQMYELGVGTLIFLFRLHADRL